MPFSREYDGTIFHHCGAHHARLIGMVEERKRKAATKRTIKIRRRE